MCDTTSSHNSRKATKSVFCRLSGVLLAALALLSFFGCKFVPKGQLDAAELQNQSLLEQKKALLAENENLKTHSRNLEDQIKQAEEELADLEERASGDQRRLSASRSDRQASVAQRRARHPITADEDPAEDSLDPPLGRGGETAEPEPAAFHDGWTAPDAERR